MPENEMSTLDLLEQREREGYEELGRLKYDDPLRGKVLNEVKTYSDIRIAFESQEQTRLNNNAKNDIEEQKLVIESEKIRNEKKRIGADVGKAVLYFVGGFSSMVGSYMLGEWFQKDSSMHRFGERLYDMITRK